MELAFLAAVIVAIAATAEMRRRLIATAIARREPGSTGSRRVRARATTGDGRVHERSHRPPRWCAERTPPAR